MNINLDKPINNVEEDKLGRKIFALNLAQAIFDNKNHDSYVVGLFGSWGMGKTSVANMALSRIMEMSEKEGNNTVVVRFSPWNYDDKNHLISLLFTAIKNEIEDKKFKKVDTKELGKLLRDYASVCDFGICIPESKIPFFAFLIQQTMFFIGRILDSTCTLNSLKKNLEKKLSESGIKIIVFIDDIDRLTNSQILDVFQLVKQVGDLPSITYLLSMDRDIVINALSEIHGINGNEYLEKIVQIPFSLPYTNQSKVYELFTTRFDSIVNEYEDGVEYQETYMRRVMDRCVYPYICNLRDVNRVLNLFTFKCSVMNKEVSLEDLLALSTVEAMDPAFYQWISENKNALCYGVSKKIATFSGDDELVECVDIELEKLKIDKEKAHNFLACIFPRFAQNLPGQYYYNGDSDLRMKMSIALPERFDYVFSFDYESLIIPRGIVLECINKFDAIKFKEYVSSLDGDKCKFLFDELSSLLEGLSNDRAEVILECLYDLEFDLDENNNRQINDSMVLIVDKVIHNILNKIRTKEDKITEYINILNRDSIESLRFVARNIYNDIFGEIYADDKPDKFVELTKVYADKVSMLSETHNLLTDGRNHSVMALWELLDKESYGLFIESKLKENNINKLKYLCSCTSKWIGSSGTKWEFDRNKYCQFFSDDEACSMIDALSSQELDQFTEEEKNKLATFGILHDKESGFADPYKVIDVKSFWKRAKKK